MGTDWKPLSARVDTGTESEYSGPHDGVPEWLFGPLWVWVVARYPIAVADLMSAFFVKSGVPLRMEARPEAVGEYRRLAMALRMSLEDPRAANPSDADGLQKALRAAAKTTPALLLDVADYWLAHDSEGNGPAVAELATMLDLAGSLYRVQASNPPCLVRRVSSEAQTAADQVIGGAGRAGELLSLAWKAAYGRNPNPGHAYRDCVRAVEAAAIPVVSPTNSRATLGTIIRDLKAKPTKWSIALHHHSMDDQVAGLVGMLDLLWTGQSGRHGAPDPSVPIDVTQEQAEAAIHLALTLVHWFTSGVVASADDWF